MKWQRIKYMPCTPVGDHLVTGSEEHIALSRKTAAEGAVLLKNTEDCLPLGKGTKLAVLGKAQIDYVKVGGGSGYSSGSLPNTCRALFSKVCMFWALSLNCL